MEQRTFGRTGHTSTVAIFGAAAFWKISQIEADKVMEQVIAAGVNHIDVAPSYGEAEIRVGPWMKTERQRFFVGCKTTERTQAGAAAEMRRSLERLNMESFDLYQIHAVTTMDELDAVTSKGGALEAILKAKEEGLTKFIGITGHGVDAPALYLEALRRFDFDSVLFPINYIQYANPTYRRNAEELLRVCTERKVGTMIIKSITKAPWGERHHSHTTWYEPFADDKHIQRAVNFALSQPITGLCTAGDTSVLPLMLKACAAFTPLNTAEQEALIASVPSEADLAPLFA
jgi:aryl-alcohol dehydrogenase-like predicted oxidoreductase